MSRTASMPHPLALTEPLRALVSFACTVAATYERIDAPVVITVLIVDLAFLALIISLSWTRDYQRGGVCVLATYNVSVDCGQNQRTRSSG